MQIWIILLPFGILCNEFMILDPLPTEYYQTETEICNQNECYPLLFEATNEFEIVKPGQKIRKGLHVSIDFETGKKMAKILDHSNSNDSSLQPIEVQQVDAVEITEPKIVPYESNSRTGITLEEKETLNKIFESLNSTDTTVIIEALEMMEDSAHQIDIGVGLTSDLLHVQQLLSLLFHQNEQVCSNAAILLGSALSNNPDAQQNVLKAQGVFDKIMNRYITSESTVCKLRIIFLISSFTRSNQTIFEAFSEMRDISQLVLHANTDSLRVKALRYIQDISQWISKSTLGFSNLCELGVNLKDCSHHPEM